MAGYSHAPGCDWLFWVGGARVEMGIAGRRFVDGPREGGWWLELRGWQWR